MSEPNQEAQQQRREVLRVLLEAIASNTTIRLPDFDRELSRSGEVALHHIGIEPNPYTGVVGSFRYQFEGEEDLLHLIVMRIDGHPLSPEDAQAVVQFLFPRVPPGLFWFKPGSVTQHFYIGHDVLPEYVD
jgi:hypothetical protein